MSINYATKQEFKRELKKLIKELDETPNDREWDNIKVLWKMKALVEEMEVVIKNQKSYRKTYKFNKETA